jgi:NAD(P)-dependent dehydrogenase (short-subunit alcohol dehydrogenase family)
MPGISGSSVGDPDGLEDWQRVIAVNQTSVFLGTKLAAEQMAKTGGGSIVNISSIMGFVGGPSGHPAYSASKGAVRIYTKSAAVRYGPLGVRVNSVHPGYMPPMLNATNANERGEKIAATPLLSNGTQSGPRIGMQKGPPHRPRDRLVPVANRRDPRATRRALTSDGAARVGGACLPTGASRGARRFRRGF